MDIKPISEEIADLSYAIGQLAELQIPRSAQREKIEQIVDALISKLESRLKMT